MKEKDSLNPTNFNKEKKNGLNPTNFNSQKDVWIKYESMCCSENQINNPGLFNALGDIFLWIQKRICRNGIYSAVLLIR